MTARVAVSRNSAIIRAACRLDLVQKFVSNGKRRFTGTASTASVDRHGDIVVPLGAVWKTPLPLLHAHDHKCAIGVVHTVVASATGLRIEAELAEGLKLADEVWGLVELGALRGLSVGFLGRESEPLPSGGRRWLTWELLEVSIVAVASNRDSLIGKSSDGSVRLIRPMHPGVKLIQGE